MKEPGNARPAHVGYDSILKRNLFHARLEPPEGGWDKDGQSQDPDEEARILAEMDSLPISRQGWVLLGTIVNSLEPGESRAILLAEGKQLALPPHGDLKGWRVALIERRTVVLEKNGRRERLLVGSGQVKPQQAPHNGSRRNLAAKDIEKALGDIPQLMKDARFSPGQIDGLQGLSLTFVRPDSFLARLGLRQNDLLTSANGKTLANLGDLAGFSTLARQDSLRLELVRNGANVVIEYDIKR